MTRSRILALAIGILLLVPNLAFAQAKKGDKDVLLFGTLATTIGGGGGTSVIGIVFFNVGKYISDQTEIGGGPELTFASGDGVTVTAGANGFWRHYMVRKNPKVSPYYGAEGTIQDFSNFTDTFFTSGIAGLKNYLTEKAALDVKGLVGLAPAHPSRIIIQLNVGVTVVW